MWKRMVLLPLFVTIFAFFGAGLTACEDDDGMDDIGEDMEESMDEAEDAFEDTE